MKFRTRVLLAAGVLAVGICLSAPVRADDEPAAKALTTADLKNVPVPSQDDLAKGDPGGTLTGNAGDIVMADPKAGLTLADVVTQVGRIASRSTSSGRSSPASW